jgi:Succinate dehydrogenase/fumarate reductase, cytochrome b subunit
MCSTISCYLFCYLSKIHPCLRLKVPVASASQAAALRDNEDFDAKNARLGRPQSPHLSIYKLQLTTLLSVTHRGTGMALGGIATVWGIGKFDKC